MNNHIDVSKIDMYTRKEFGLSSYDDSVEFYNWLQAQEVRFTNAKHALRVYRGQEEVPTAESKTQRQQRYTKSSFRSRQQLNGVLRRNGYIWHKVATFGEFEESEYGECYRWQLYSSDGRPVTVKEALAEIG